MDEPASINLPVMGRSVSNMLEYDNHSAIVGRSVTINARDMLFRLIMTPYGWVQGGYVYAFRIHIYGTSHCRGTHN